MSRSRHFFSAIVPLFLCLALARCGGGSSLENSTLGSVPDSWGKYLTPGGVTATLDVYGSDGALATHVDLIVDMEQGTVSAPQFKIPIGDTYRFIIIFNYALSASEAIPYAYADFTWLVDEFSEEVSFSENDIRYGYDAQDPLISASLSEGKIPNLDLDGDGWTNWEELRDKVNPKSATSVPIVPTVEVRGQQDGAATTATVVVTARDNAHVEDLRLVDPLCGVTVISDTLVNNVDGSVTRTLTLRLDLLSVSKNPRTLQGLADDGVTPAQNANHTLNFTVVGSASQPYFVFTEPEEKGEVEGDAVFRGIACSRAEIDVGSVRFANQEISSVAWTGQRTPSGDFEMTSEAVNTTVLPDGLVTLRVEVQDSNGKTGQGSRVFSVVNDNQIKLVSPVGRRWVFGNEQIAVIVKNLPDSNLVVIEGNPNFSLTSSTAGGAVGKLAVGNLAEGAVLPLTFKAVRSDGSEVVRKVEFTVRNRPQIQFVPEATKVFRNWSTNLFYKVVNVDPQQLFIEGEPTDGKGSRICEEDAVAKGITVCTGKYPVKVTSSESFEISAARLATSGESCVNCGAEASSGTVNAGVTLPKDIPEINAAIVGDDEPEAPARVKFPVESPTQHYRLTVKDLREGTEIFADELQSDETAILNALEARRDYIATLQVLNGPGGNVLAEMFREFTTGDLGLVGWWRFKDDPNKLDCPGETSSRTVCDYSGKGNHGDPNQTLIWINENLSVLDDAIDFSSNSKIVIPHSISLEIFDGATFSCRLEARANSVTTGIIVKDSPQPGPFFMEQVGSNNLDIGLYTFEGTIGSWKGLRANILGLIGSSFRASGVYDGSFFYLYIDNQLIDSRSISGNIVNYPQSINLGYSPYHDNYFSGKLYDCMMFGRSLSLGEVGSL